VDVPQRDRVDALSSQYQQLWRATLDVHQRQVTIRDLVFDSVLRTPAAYRARNETLPPELGHVIIFYSVGELTRQRLHELGRPGYEPYAGRLGLYARSLAWTVYRQALAKHWQLYLEGTIDRTTSLQSLMEELG
jgi:hypothetical protein